MMMNFELFEFWGRQTRPNRRFGAQGSVLTHDVENSTWLEELVSESNTLQAQEEQYSAGLIAGRDPRKLYVIL